MTDPGEREAATNCPQDPTPPAPEVKGAGNGAQPAIFRVELESNKIQLWATIAQIVAAGAMIIAAAATIQYAKQTSRLNELTKEMVETTAAVYEAAHYPNLRVQFIYRNGGKRNKAFGVLIVNEGDVIIKIKEVLVSAKISSRRRGEDLVTVQRANPMSEVKPKKREFVRCDFKPEFRQYFLEGVVEYLNADITTAPAVQIPRRKDYPSSSDVPYSLSNRHISRKILDKCFWQPERKDT